MTTAIASLKLLCTLILDMTLRNCARFKSHTQDCKAYLGKFQIIKLFASLLHLDDLLHAC